MCHSVVVHPPENTVVSTLDKSSAPCIFGSVVSIENGYALLKTERAVIWKRMEISQF